MSLEITAIVLLAAALHAGWNTLIKIGGDRVAVMAFVTLAGSLISLLVLPFVDPPDPASWPLLALTILLHTAYHFFLPIAYDHGDTVISARSTRLPADRRRFWSPSARSSSPESFCHRSP